MPDIDPAARARLVARIEAYLRLQAERRAEEAQRFLAPGARLVFPGGRVFARLQDLAAHAAQRYRSSGKRIERWDVLAGDDGTLVVYCLGTLEGVNLHGIPFRGVRYIDRFEVRDDLIVLQEVWNDLAESGVLGLTEPSPPIVPAAADAPAARSGQGPAIP